LLVIIAVEYVIRRKWNRVAHFKYLYPSSFSDGGSRGKGKAIPL